MKVIFLVHDCQGLHSQNQSDPSYCNVGGCRGIFHRELLIDLNANPTAPFSPDTYHWIFSTPPTANKVNTVTTSFSQTESQGLVAKFDEHGLDITFSRSVSESRSYGQSEEIEGLLLSPLLFLFFKIIMIDRLKLNRFCL